MAKKIAVEDERLPGLVGPADYDAWRAWIAPAVEEAMAKREAAVRGTIASGGKIPQRGEAKKKPGRKKKGVACST